MVGPP